MFESFSVAAVVRLSVAGTSSLSALGRQLGVVQTSATKTQQALATMQRGLVAGATLAAFGVGIGAGMLKAANATAKLAMNLKAVQLAGRYTNAEMQGLTKTVFDVSNITARSALDASAWMSTVRSATGYTADQLRTIMPVIGRFTDVMSIGFGSRNMSQNQAVLLAARIAGMFHLTTPQQMTEAMRLTVGAYRNMPGTGQELMTQLRQFASIGMGLKVPVDQQLAFAAYLNSVGMTGRAGTGLAEILLKALPSPSLLTQTAIRQHFSALAGLGMLPGPNGVPNFMAGGNFDLMTWLKDLTNAYNKQVLAVKDPTARAGALAVFTQNANKAFGITGERIVMALIGSYPKLAQTLANIRTESPIDKQQEELMRTWGQQWSRMMTNAANVVFKTFLPGVSGGGPAALSKIADALGNFANSITPDRAATLVRIFAGLAAMFTVSGAAVMLAAVISAFSTILGAAGLTVTGPALLAIGAGLGALYLAIRYWPQIVPSLKQMASVDAATIATVVSDVSSLVRAIGSIKVDPNLVNLMSTMANASRSVSNSFTGAQNWIAGLTGKGGAAAGPLMNQLPSILLRMLLYQLTHGNTPSSASPIAPPLLPKPGTVGRASAGHVTAYITINQQPGEDTESMLDRLMHRLDQKLRDAGRGSGAGVSHPMIAPSPRFVLG